MTGWLFPATAGLLFAIGLYGVLARTAVLRRLMAVNIMMSGVFLFLILVSTRTPGGPDPVPQAMVLTGLVITVSLTAFALTLIRHVRAVLGRDDLEGENDG